MEIMKVLESNKKEIMRIRKLKNVAKQREKKKQRFTKTRDRRSVRTVTGEKWPHSNVRGKKAKKIRDYKSE